MNLKKLESKIEYQFQNSDFAKESLTHRSYINENRRWPLPHNERLEFLGDAVLELVSTEELYHRYPDKPEGDLTLLRAALVNYQYLAGVARDIGLDEQILLSRGEAKDVGRARETILANAIEALIGALYLDGGYKSAKSFVNKFVMAGLDNVMKKENYRDAKSLLQEKFQANKKLTPIYKTLEQSGPEHEKYFKVAVFVGGQQLATGEGYSKREAELAAAAKALKANE